MNDSEITTLIKNGMRHDKGNSYFVRKVMNRLPRKPESAGYVRILRVACALCTVILAVLWINYFSSFSSANLRPVYFFSLWCTTIFLILVGLRCIFVRRIRTGL